jgi:hypothetical protein
LFDGFKEPSMSIPSIRNAVPVDRASANTPQPAAAAASVRAPASVADAAPGQTGEPPAPLRFPWLSRLSQQLESAVRQRAAFSSAPVLGDHVDRSA